MSSKQEITSRLANRLKKERTDKGISLDALSKLSGISCLVLSQIERGESSPTASSLWSLTRALNIDLSTLLDQESKLDHPIHALVRNDQTPVITNNEARCTIRILSDPNEAESAEIYDITFNKKAHLESSAHHKGSVEHLTVLSGNLKVSSGGHVEHLSIGDTIRYAADVEHVIMAEKEARALLIIKNPQRPV